jgi:hypothetical protein
MSQAWLSYDNAPPLWLPASFFAAATGWLFVLAAAAGLAVPAEANRYLPQVLALTHLLALGVLGNAMLGALLQIAAVVAAVPTPRPRCLLIAIGLPWQLGTALLASGFLAGLQPICFEAAAACLLCALAALLGHALAGLMRSPARDATSQGLRSALLGLAFAMPLGVLAALALTGRIATPVVPLLTSHVLWAGGVWLFGLVLAVSQTVIPMFLITPPFPALTRHIGAMLLPLALVTSLASAVTDGTAAAVALGTLATLFAASVLRCLGQSRRPDDPARSQWRTVMLYLLAAVAAAWASLVWPGSASLPLACGVLGLGGFGLGAILNMACKILPFLCWLRLKALNVPRQALPPTHGFLAETTQRRIGRWHMLWLAVALLWCRWPQATAPLLSLASLALFAELASAAGRLIGRYRLARRHAQLR